jgi:hypothetical protein
MRRQPSVPGRQFVVPILRSGIPAREVCQHNGFAEVAAVFDRSLYLRAGDMFICIGEPDIGNGPLTLIADRGAAFRLSDLGLHSGQPALISERRIRIGDHAWFALDRCEPWRQPRWPDRRSPTQLTDTLAALARAAVVEAPQEGLARQVFCLPERRGGPVSRIARARIASFENWLFGALETHRVPTSSPLEPVQGLIGLGPGLTPSGDDFLLAALALLDATGERKAHAALAHALTDASPALTSPLSHCFLRTAAAGYVGENLYRAVSCIVSGEVDPAIAAFRKVGHSSGWDMLAGIATALKVFSAVRLA